MSLQPPEEETAAKIGHIKKIGSLYSNVVEDLEILADDTTTAQAYVYECVPFIEQFLHGYVDFPAVLARSSRSNLTCRCMDIITKTDSSKRHSFECLISGQRRNLAQLPIIAYGADGSYDARAALKYRWHVAKVLFSPETLAVLEPILIDDPPFQTQYGGHNERRATSDAWNHITLSKPLATMMAAGQLGLEPLEREAGDAFELIRLRLQWLLAPDEAKDPRRNDLVHAIDVNTVRRMYGPLRRSAAEGEEDNDNRSGQLIISGDVYTVSCETAPQRMRAALEARWTLQMVQFCAGAAEPHVPRPRDRLHASDIRFL
ncbi:hypothetical protein LMH87_002822 [Akanthomyces muscarius]|uniref:Uncharacterized protein n=1 Tax=Akanthomyces muscarius TaxID=2231603 RepID=A0A9W8Q7U2_AKAMU|nr:hypothetical protein LMH87_002822 [Akanthomyces muscarius]KAJ4148347.1 hypothetical protein LMH87_002822 [Akanthomyces muscarius]